MDILNFTFKLLKHGGIFLLRVGSILIPSLGSLMSFKGEGNRAMSDYRHASVTGHFPDGTPERWEYNNIHLNDEENDR